MLQFRRDLDLVEHLDKLGYDEFWCGEHHSSGWEMIGSPEMFLAAAGERTKRIKLATGSSPALPPSVQRGATDGAARLHDRRTDDLRLRAWSAGVGRPHARHRSDAAARPPGRGHRRHPPPDARRTPDRQVRLVHPAGRRPAAVAAAGGHAFAVASQISPSGMTLAGEHGIGIISIGSLSEEGLNALPTQWGFAEAAAAEHGQTVERKNWRVLMSWHIAETRDQARAEAREGLLRHHNEYITATLQRPGARAYKSADEAVDKTAFVPGAVATIGTPDDLVERIKSVLEISGGFGTVVGFVHDWAKQGPKIDVLHNIDVAPTIMEILDVAPAPTVDGEVITKILQKHKRD